MYYVLICILIGVFMSISCGLNEKTDSENTKLIENVKSNDQGEDEGNEKNPPVIIPPIDENDQGEDEDNGKKPPIVNPPIIDPEDDQGEEGIFILTDIPSEFDGKHAFFMAGVGCYISYSYYGFNSITYDPPNYYLNMGQIKNGTVKLPVWDFNFHWMEGSLSAINNFRYLGNDTFEFRGFTGSSDAIIAIYDFSAFFVESETAVRVPAEAPLAMITFPVTFSNGSAVISFGDGKLLERP